MEERKIVEAEPDKSPRSGNYSVDGMFNLPDKFAILSKMVLSDLNKRTVSPKFYLYSKEQIQDFLKDPYKNQKALRDAVIYLYGASSHFRRIIQYFVSLSDLSYIVAPYRIDTATVKKKTLTSQYRKTLNTLSVMDIKNQFPKILTVCLREDTFYGTIWATKDNISVQQLPSDYCTISTIEGNVFNVTFNFSYFDLYSDQLDYYPPEFEEKYRIYQNNRSGMKYQELNCPNSFAIKCNADTPSYPIPPFAGILREIYDIEDYKQLKLTKTELENYAILVMSLGIKDDGDWVMDLDKAKEFWRNLDSVLPEEVGSVLSPMPINKISFEKSNVGDADTVAEAEQRLFNSAGVSSLLFNNEKSSANALSLSIQADQAITYGIVKSIETMVNRYIQGQSYGKNFKVTFLDCSPFNRKAVGEAYLKACQFGIPMVSFYCASQGLSQADMECMNYLENDVLDIKSKFIPLQSSSTQSGSALDSDPGAPEKDIGDLTDSGEQTRENDE